MTRRIWTITLLSLSALLVQAQNINIRGTVYGGGKAGAVGTNYAGDGVGAGTKLEDVTLDEAKLTAGKPDTITHVTVNSGTVTTVFGGGEQGRTFGGTKVIVQGTAQVGRDELKKSVHGGVYGGGDGAGAGVFGPATVEIRGGTIPQKVYGGGNQAPLVGNTFVHLLGGNIRARGVFGGARMADIYGYSYVFVDGDNLKNDLVINTIYGGNDISGEISTELPEGANWPWVSSAKTPFGVITPDINGTWNAFVRTTNPDVTGKKFFAGQLFGGGDGDYTYTANSDQYDVDIPLKEWDDAAGKYVSKSPRTYSVSGKPTIEKTYIEIGGGTIGYVYGGGNAATVTENTTICIDNKSEVVTSVKDASDNELLTAARMKEMGLNVITTDQTKSDYQFSRVFGGNNLEPMRIRPTWNLISGQIDNLYSGGNAGDMTHPNGILLALTNDGMTVNNVYGGCRMANVRPKDNDGNDMGQLEAEENVGGYGYNFPADYAARLLIKGGNINNVYGGCDVSGSIYFGTDVRIMSSVWGSVYGSGNGAYAYTDNAALANDAKYGDFYYPYDATTDTQGSAVKLNSTKRPNVENTYIHITGTAEKDTYIGNVYCGGNSATLRSRTGNFEVDEDGNPLHAKLHIGKYVVAENVFLGSNGVKMKDDAILKLYANENSDYPDFSHIDLSNEAQVNAYMKGVGVSIHPEVIIDDDVNYTAKIGSFYCGGNVGSMLADGLFTLDFNKPLLIYNKVVGGCNNANIGKTDNFIGYEGGIKGNPADGGKKLVLNFDGIKLEPRKVARVENEAGEIRPVWNPADGRIQLDWNTKYNAYDEEKSDSIEKRLVGGNIYGGCYSSGHINGDVEINLLSTTCYKDEVFGAGSGVLLDEQGDDVLGEALNVFGAGYGKDSEIRGSTEVNLLGGYTFQIFGGGEEGTVRDSVTINLHDASSAITAATETNAVAEAEYVYGGGFRGDVGGKVRVNTGNVRVYDIFAGACNADIGGHTELYIGNLGFPWIRDNVYGGNDLGGSIIGTTKLTSPARSGDIVASTYVKYCQGRVDSLFGGCFGNYDYDALEVVPPTMGRAYVDFSPTQAKTANAVGHVYGGSAGYEGYESVTGNKDLMQESSYVLVNIPQTMTNFAATEVFGAGANCGVGMRNYLDPGTTDDDKLKDVTAIVDLWQGQIAAAYGGSFSEGMTRRTEVCVPTGSTIKLEKIFGGAYGKDNSVPCDVYESHVNYSSADATVGTYWSGIYGGNNNCRRTLYSFVDINSPVYYDNVNGYVAPVYGAGLGENTWAQYTEVNLHSGAEVYEVYGGGSDGMVLNEESVNKWLGDDAAKLVAYGGGLVNPLVHENGLDKKTNTNVYIHEGASVSGYYFGTKLYGGYAYGGGYGSSATVSGSTYIGLHGGTVVKDLYAGGSGGGVQDKFADKSFVATTNAYIEGGTVRNCYGGGYEGHVGYHDTSKTSTDGDILGESNVVIGIRKELAGADTTFVKGAPTVQRNAYGGGEGGAVFGTANITLRNGYIGYVYEDGQYKEKLDDETYYVGSEWMGKNSLVDYGNIFGSGYDDKSSVDISNVTMWGGTVRGNLFGGGELSVVGRGKTKESGESNSIRELQAVYKAGETHIYMYNGHVLRDVFGGGRGYNALGFGSSHEIYTDGYVFGSTDVNIYGGEIGTEAGVADGYGNVFGGGDVGYVYSRAYINDMSPKDADGYVRDNGELTEDCHVLVTPYCQVKAGQSVTINDKTFDEYDYVPIDYLNRLKGKNADGVRWSALDVSGIIIRNAVFAGGNVSSGNDKLYANTKTVMGNVTASIVDVYNRDLITIGTEHVGGLYGDGNLTLVDGYRELNITNYGTDYYGMSDNISLDEYYNLTDRERAYFELKYKCVTGYTVKDPVTGKDKTYTVGESISEETYEAIDDAYKGNWEQAGFCSIYAGRLMNTIQRADFVGIFGSRMVLQGAKDRVPSVADKTDYTVNRVGEVSLNQVKSIAEDTDADASHGNYFGIYSIVNYMGALTSDVDFYDATRTTDNANYTADGSTFYEWKAANPTERKRNNGYCANRVALASGVYLELTTEKSTGNTTATKDWGYITGVAQLELINVKTGLGGGYVYAKNVHGTRSLSGNDQTIISPHNQAAADGSHRKAVTNKLYTYSAGDLQVVQTSGNFVHNLKQIVDDCYPTTGAYSGENAAPAHYWYIRGTSYVYDQYITAYTGISNAYSQVNNIPLNVNAASYGRMKIEDIQPNLYAYYATTEASPTARTPLQNTDENGDNYSVLINNEKTYYLNDPITYWDYLQLSEAEQRHFVRDTYLTVVACQVGGVDYPAGTVLLPSEYEQLKAANPTVWNVAREEEVDFDDVFRLSNALSHEKGFVLTYSVDNPKAWDSGEDDATYSPNQTAVYGQHFYNVGEVINSDLYEEGVAVKSYVDASTQANMVTCYVATEEFSFTYGGRNYRFTTGSPIAREDYDADTWSSLGSKVQQASICISTLEFTDTYAENTVLYGELIWPDRYNELVAAYAANEGISTAEAKKAVDQHFKQAYYCQKEGLYGGGHFDSETKYSALRAWSSLSEEDRQQFHFNYDALNLLIDPDYAGIIERYDNYQSPYAYSSVQPVDYQAIYQGTENLTYTDNDGKSQTVTPSQVLDREQFENMPNEQYHYAPISVTTDNQALCYVVKVAFTRGDTPYAVGQTISSDVYAYLSADQKVYIDQLSFSEGDINKTFYYCRDQYQVNQHNGMAVYDERTGQTIGKGQSVGLGTLLSQDSYDALPNEQKKFTVSGTAPEETTTLYVARGSDIYDLQKDRVITVIFSYEYTESDESGEHIEPISERHIVNIHLHFESGVPAIDLLHTPPTSLPGDFVGMKQPSVKPGAYELLGGGWEIFTNEEDAERHRNGIEFNNTTPVYWYQDGQYLAYYAKTYLGKTYSNYVQFSVANYHDLKTVMEDEHHLYVDNPSVKRPSKIYLNNYGSDAKSGIDLLKDFYDMTLDGTLDDHVKNAGNLDFFLHANQAPKTYTDWTPIGDGGTTGSTVNCFEGTLHGEGYTVSGLNNSLFGHLCGHVYNLGVTGSFTSAGVADTGDGYVENCWVKTTASPDGSVYAVFGNPSDQNTSTKQIENCYYGIGGGKYKTTDATHGLARKMTNRQFNNGEVAYDLNGFYLKKRYNDQAEAADTVATWNYVEDRYSNVDFLYADGEISTSTDVRQHIDAEGNYYYTPVWPDDYLFFGQVLDYGHKYVSGHTHQSTPAHLAKDGTSHTLLANSASNRVYRAPAYYGNKEMGIFHFNPYAVIEGSSKGYPGMTAVDFSGHTETPVYTKRLSGGVFFAPVFDAATELSGVASPDQTRNLLVYSPNGSTNTTRIVLANYFKEPAVEEKDDDASTGMKADYRAVAAIDTDAIRGHLAYWNGSRFVATADHTLVDRQDFNAPVGYSFTGDRRMWYQRTPDNYVTKVSDASKGWEDIALPFTAELVTTPDKGEITHFYGTSTKGHEYWLRGFQGIASESGGTATATMRYPDMKAGNTKSYTNTFLWDYYYEQSGSLDENGDEYQNYYNATHDYADYPMAASGVPYIIGFPSDYYYEFDLSGKFVPQNTASPIDKLSAQPVIFASEKNASIGVSDDEMAGIVKTQTSKDYTFHPTYQSRSKASLSGDAYVLNADGYAFEKLADGGSVAPFRTYFTASAAASARTRSIIFGDGDGQLGDSTPDPSDKGEDLLITSGHHKIIVTSHLRRETEVRIVTPAGITLTTFAVQPGETVETRIVNQGVYIVQTTDGRYNKKLAVR